MMYQAGLVLEGGAMKGVYTAGVLDFFLDKEIIFSSCYGVSAGACHMCSYLSGQKKRAYRISTEYLDNKRYCGGYNLITTGDIFGVAMCYDLIPNYLDPYDYEAFSRYPGKAYAVVTNVETGKAEYIRLKEMHKDIEAVRASSSMPLVSRAVKIGNGRYLDGGIADAIPLLRSVKDGNKKHVVVMTKEVGFLREKSVGLAVMKARYLAYPKIYQQMKNRHTNYNGAVAQIEKLEALGKVFVIRPKQKSAVGRIEKDSEKLKALYEEGYLDAQSCYLKLLQYLEQ